MRVINKKLIPAIALIICTIISLFVALQTAKAITDATVWLNPSAVTVNLYNDFTVGVDIDVSTPNISGYDFELHYDPLMMTPVAAWDGGFLLSPIATFNWNIFHYPSYSAVRVYAITGNASGSTGYGNLATVQFRCIGPGRDNITLSGCWLDDGSGLFAESPTIEWGTCDVDQHVPWEPLKLQHLVELPYPYHLSDLPFVPPASPEGYAEIKAELEAKGYEFSSDYGGGLYHIDSFFDVYFEPGSEPFEGTVASWWSNNTLEDGTRACLLTAEMEDGSNMAMGFVTNLLPPEEVPEVDPYIIVNAQPYLFVRFYWWAWAPLGRIVTWSYWWYDSHSHANWFWKPYYWWRTYTKSYYYPYTLVPYWRPWWSWWWHWVYWRHWNWWCTGFPYDP
jgi:hypothetical protein